MKTFKKTTDVIWHLAFSDALLKDASDSDTPTWTQFQNFLENQTCEKYPEVLTIANRAIIVTKLIEAGLCRDMRLIDAELERLRNVSAECAARALLDYKRALQNSSLLAHSMLTKPKEEREEKPPQRTEEDLCVVCMDELRSVVFRPCMHRVCCQSCAEANWKLRQICPWCQEKCAEP